MCSILRMEGLPSLPMKSRIEAIQNLQAPSTAKACKSFCGVVNYLSLFCKDLQKILKPIYELTRKEMPFHWSDLHQKAFARSKRIASQSPSPTFTQANW